MASRRKYRGRKDRLRFAQLWVLSFIPVYLLLPGFKGYSGISPFKTWLYYGLAAMLLVGNLGDACTADSTLSGVGRGFKSIRNAETGETVGEGTQCRIHIARYGYAMLELIP